MAAHAVNEAGQARLMEAALSLVDLARTVVQATVPEHTTDPEKATAMVLDLALQAVVQADMQQGARPVGPDLCSMDSNQLIARFVGMGQAVGTLISAVGSSGPEIQGEAVEAFEVAMRRVVATHLPAVVEAYRLRTGR